MTGRPKVLVWMTAFIAIVSSGCTVARYGRPPEGRDKVVLCHKGKQTLEVAEPAVEAHLGHGDRLGRCR